MEKKQAEQVGRECQGRGEASLKKVVTQGFPGSESCCCRGKSIGDRESNRRTGPEAGLGGM